MFWTLYFSNSCLRTAGKDQVSPCLSERRLTPSPGLWVDHESEGDSAWGQCFLKGAGKTHYLWGWGSISSSGPSSASSRLQGGGARGVSALETLISNFRTPNLGSLFSPSLTESSSIKALQQTFNTPHIMPGPAHHGSPCPALGFPCRHLCSLWPAQSSPVCLAVGYALEKKKKNWQG